MEIRKISIERLFLKGRTRKGIHAALVMVASLASFQALSGEASYRSTSNSTALSGKFKVDFQKTGNTKMRLMVGTESSDESTRDAIADELIQLVDDFSANPDPANVSQFVTNLLGLLGQLNPNEIPGGVENGLDGMDEFLGKFGLGDGSGESTTLVSELQSVMEDYDPENPESQQQVDALMDRLKTLLEGFQEEFPELVNQLMTDLETLILDFQNTFPAVVEKLTQDIENVINDYQNGIDPDQNFLDENNNLDQDALDSFLDDTVGGGLTDMNTRISQLIDTFHEQDLPNMLDTLIDGLKQKIDKFVQEDLPAALGQLLEGVDQAISDWKASSGFGLDEKSDAEGQTLTVTVGETEFSGSFDDKGQLVTDGMTAKLTGDAGVLRVDLFGDKLFQALGLDSTEEGTELEAEIDVNIEISGGEAKSGYEVGRASSVSVILDKTLDFVVRQKAERSAVGKF